MTSQDRSLQLALVVIGLIVFAVVVIPQDEWDVLSGGDRGNSPNEQLDPANDHGPAQSGESSPRLPTNPSLPPTSHSLIPPAPDRYMSDLEGVGSEIVGTWLVTVSYSTGLNARGRVAIGAKGDVSSHFRDGGMFEGLPAGEGTGCGSDRRATRPIHLHSVGHDEYEDHQVYLFAYYCDHRDGHFHIDETLHLRTVDGRLLGERFQRVLMLRGDVGSQDGLSEHLMNASVSGKRVEVDSVK